MAREWHYRRLVIARREADDSVQGRRLPTQTRHFLSRAVKTCLQAIAADTSTAMQIKGCSVRDGRMIAMVTAGRRSSNTGLKDTTTIKAARRKMCRNESIFLPLWCRKEAAALESGGGAGGARGPRLCVRSPPRPRPGSWWRSLSPATTQPEFHAEKLKIYKLDCNQNYYTFALILLTKMILCRFR